MRTSSFNLFWIIVLASSPLAYLGSIWLETRLPNQTVVTPVSREQVIAAAARFAAGRHVDTRGWRISVANKKESPGRDVVTALRHVHAPALSRVTAPAEVIVLFRATESNRWIKVSVAPDGTALEFHQSDPPGKSTPMDEAAARELARSFILERLGPGSGFELKDEKITADDKRGVKRTFSWHSPVPGVPQAKASLFAQVTGGTVVAGGTSVSFDKAYINQLRPFRGWMSGIQAAAGIFVGILGIFALVRYIRRAGDKEVSHRRTILVALIFAGLTCMVLFADPQAFVVASQEGAVQSTGQIIFIAFFAVIGMSIAGMFLGIAYGAGEGALRESYPGKLTSLDALLSGKVFSSNVAYSVLMGGALAGWLSLFQNAAILATGGTRSGVDLAVFSSALHPLPLLDLVISTGSDALLLMSFGLLLPVALLRPRIRVHWLFYTLLPVFCALCASLNASKESLQNFIVTGLILVVATCIPFFCGDLLAAAACGFALQLFADLVERSLVSDRWLTMTIYVATFGLVFLLAQVWFARYGRTYSEREVRPRYARFVAEHLSMQAEISAAREAQQRLLPDAPPRIAGVSIAGSCVPSREVSGDFYDFYPLDDHRLGVFLAEGSKGELGAAMTIALAKGYLLHATRQDSPPVEILRRLRALFESTFHGEHADVSMLYAVVDTSTRMLRFARTGGSPRIVVNGNEPAEELSPGDADKMAVRNGAANLSANDALVFYTTGFAAQIAREKRQAANRFLAKTVADIRSGSAVDVHFAIMQAAIRRKNDLPADDVTAVVIRFDRAAERTMEVVA
jgi:hypothetical protein